MHAAQRCDTIHVSIYDAKSTRAIGKTQGAVLIVVCNLEEVVLDLMG